MFVSFKGVILLLHSFLSAYITAKDTVKPSENAPKEKLVTICQNIGDEFLKPENNIPGLEYLGTGYNILKALPFGSDEMYIDPGYMQPVIQFKWECNVNKRKNTPIGVWFRQEAACHKSHKSRKLDSSSSLEEIISEDITTSFGSGEPLIKATKEFNSLKQWVEEQNSELVAYKTYCAIYSTGMILSHKWNFSAGFEAVIHELMEILKKDGCKLAENDSVCKEIIEKWFFLFDEYGTHTLTRITFGGKIINLEKVDAQNAKNTLNNKNARQVEINAHIGSINFSSNDEKKEYNSFSKEKQYSKVYIIGGDSFDVNLDDKSFGNWIRTVDLNPMPIRIETTPLALFIPNELQLSYWKAFNLYKRCGYDILSGSSVDEKSSFNVNNYRSPVMDSYSFGDSNDDFGIWIRNEFMCNISIEETIIDSEENLVKTLEVNNEESYSNIWSSHYKNEAINDDLLDTLKRYRKLLIKKYQCTVYSAGISNIKERKNMKLLHKVIQELVESCKGNFDTSECPPDLYLKDPYNPKCSRCIMPFMKFFIDYGTHVTTKITMGTTCIANILNSGGIIRKFLRKNSYDSKNRGKYTNKTTIGSSTFFGLINSESEDLDERSSKYDNSGDTKDVYTFTIGPEPSSPELSNDVLTEWVMSVSKNPAPIKVEISPIEEIVSDREHFKILKSALEYYSRTKGKDVVNSNYLENTMSKLIKEANNTILLKSDVNNEVCSNEERILYGFGVTFNADGEILQAKLCYSGLYVLLKIEYICRNACLLESSKSVSSSFVWAACHSTRLYNFQQKLVKGLNGNTLWSEAKCSGKMVIAFGMILRFKDDNDKIFIRRCISGGKVCGITNLGPNGIIWIICVPPNSLDTRVIIIVIVDHL
ncbi:MAC/Perforin domain containing protein [Theileria equi strain WA]|uniref:MAC/Perforin domain containing protein n=1 Tax=Theileria equi strain WA TaxID=1537102 RepID=L1LD86_THEEQ|nr:MAC/Perforin domain containing protein [Theileria equi strain WA]EKX73138.1 MAC/Perforin domain containing protein [Theileria equi strain WA]|eukprot:XP_004832590.1 MAC/Perforin domain containing protein [Theileria equi strain WA]